MCLLETQKQLLKQVLSVCRTSPPSQVIVDRACGWMAQAIVFIQLAIGPKFFIIMKRKSKTYCNCYPNQGCVIKNLRLIFFDFKSRKIRKHEIKVVVLPRNFLNCFFRAKALGWCHTFPRRASGLLFWTIRGDHYVCKFFSSEKPFCSRFYSHYMLFSLKRG